MIKVHWLMSLTDLVWPGLFYNTNKVDFPDIINFSKKL